MVTTPRPRRRADAERNITAIVDAGLRLFAAEGSVSMADVAREASVGRVTLYGHFSSREDLLESVVRRALDEVNDLVLTEDFDTAPVDEVLTSVIRTSWRKMDRYRRLRQVALDELGATRLRRLHDKAQVATRFRQLMARGQHEGTIRGDLSPDWLVTVLFSLLHAAADEVDDGRLPQARVPETVEATLLAAVATKG